ncbi:MAG: metal-independent alpha-mannosidase, partial [Cytophagaceae bacterium]
PVHGRVYAYEVDGYGGHTLMDDANVPSLLALPYLGAVPLHDPTYQNTRRLVLSLDNPFFYKGKAAEGIVGAGEAAHGDGDGPNHIDAHVRPTDALGRRALVKEGIIGREQQLARVLVRGVVEGHGAKVGQGQQAGHVGIVHQGVGAVAIDLVGVHAAVHGVHHGGVLAEGRRNFVGQRHELLVGRRIVVDVVEHQRRLAQAGHGKEVAGHQKGQ